MCSNVRLAHCSIHTVCDIADRIKEDAELGIKVVPQSLSEWTTPKIMDASLLHFYCIRNN